MRTYTAFRQTTDNPYTNHYSFVPEGDDETGETITFLDTLDTEGVTPDTVASVEVTSPRWISGHIKGVSDAGAKLLDEFVPATEIPDSWSEAAEALTTQGTGTTGETNPIARITLSRPLGVSLQGNPKVADMEEIEIRLFGTIEDITGGKVRLAEAPTLTYDLATRV